MSIVINDVLIPNFESNSFSNASIKIDNELISEISKTPLKADLIIEGKGKILTPGLIDCHCHIESSLLPPAEFGNKISEFGTLHVIADCHEIANVAGRKGLEFFMENANQTKCNIRFAIPSCVPATPFATSGGTLGLEDISTMMAYDNVVALGEVMNIPAVLANDENIINMIKVAKKYGKRVNGHAPHLDDDTLLKYISVGIEDDHESETYTELEKKIEAGLKVFLREGTAEHTEDKAYKILEKYSNDVMFCTDDKTINHIIETGHINYHLKKAVANGVSPIIAIKAATYNGLKYYSLDEYSEIKVGNKASLVLFKDIIDFEPDTVISEGKIISQTPASAEIPQFIQHSFTIDPVTQIPEVPDHIKNICMEVTDGSLITKKLILENTKNEIEIKDDILKITVFERYGHANKSAAKINGFGLVKGAIATSMAHDCHNIIAVGTNDKAIMKAINAVINENGGMAVYDEETITMVPLHIGGIVSDKSATELSKELDILKEAAKSMGCQLTDPFATLSFMALEVIPEIKITDKGLFDVTKFEYL